MFLKNKNQEAAENVLATAYTELDPEITSFEISCKPLQLSYHRKILHLLVSLLKKLVQNSWVGGQAVHQLLVLRKLIFP